MFVLALSCVSASACADQPTSEQLQNWHQWRGPLATGEAPSGSPPTNWDEHTNIKWKVEIPGLGHATPIIWGDRIFILTAIKTDHEVDAEKSAATEGALPRRVPARLVAFADDGTATSGTTTDAKSA